VGQGKGKRKGKKKGRPRVGRTGFWELGLLCGLRFFQADDVAQ
jgi:hypothetical protein